MSQSGVYKIGKVPGATYSLTGDLGASVTPDLGGNINILGLGDVVTFSTLMPNTLYVNYNPVLKWHVQTTDFAINLNSEKYICQSAALIHAYLPISSAVGLTVELVGNGTGLFTIVQNPGQVIHFIGTSTTVGAAGSITSTKAHDAISLVCTVDNTEWTVLSSSGNFIIT